MEVSSPNDRINRTIQHITQMLHAGVAQMWLVDPEGHDVNGYRAGQDPILLTEGQELTGDPALPDFRCRIAEFFALPSA